LAAGRGIKCHVCVEDVVVVTEPYDEENARNILLEDDSPVGRTRHLLSCFRVELKVLTLSMSLLSTALGTHSLRALHTSLIVGRSFISLDKLLRIVSCTGRGHLRFIPRVSPCEMALSNSYMYLYFANGRFRHASSHKMTANEYTSALMLYGSLYKTSGAQSSGYLRNSFHTRRHENRHAEA